MRNVSVVRRTAVLLMLMLMLLVIPAAYATDVPPFDPPEARIHPPGGIVAEPESSFFESFLEWLVLAVRIHPPIG
jgi:hypothetical protein